MHRPSHCDAPAYRRRPRRPGSLRAARIALVTPYYPPHVHEIAAASQRLAEGLCTRGLVVAVFAAAWMGEEPPDGIARPDDAPYVLHLSSPLEGRVMLRHLEARAGPFALLHAISMASTHECLAIAGSERRPVVATVRECEGPLDARDLAALQQAAWVTSLYTRPLNVIREAAPASSPPRRSVVLPPVADMGASRARWRLTPASAEEAIVAVMDRQPPSSSDTLDEIRRLLPAPGMRFVPCGELRASRSSDTLDPMPQWTDVRALLVLSLDEAGWVQVLDALAAGVPVVAFALDDLARVVTHEVSALLVPAGDRAAAAAAVAAVLTSDELASRLSAGARQAVSGLTEAAELAHFLRIYADVLR